MTVPTIDLDELLSRVRQTVPPPVTLTFWLDPVDQGARDMTDDARANAEALSREIEELCAKRGFVLAPSCAVEGIWEGEINIISADSDLLKDKRLRIAPFRWEFYEWDE